MKPLSDKTLYQIDQELAGIGFSPQELQQIAPQVGSWVQEIVALDALDLGEVAPSLIPLPEEG